LKEKVEETKVYGIQSDDRVTAVMAMVAFHGNSSIGHEVDGDLDKELARLVADKEKGQGEALIYLWESFKPTLKRSLTYGGPITHTPKQYIKEAEWVAGIIGADLKGMFKEVSKQKGFCEPKSWAGLNADGTEKKGKSKKVEKKGKNKKAKGKKKGVRTCRVCGCTDSAPCIVDGEPCHWVAGINENLCSVCEKKLLTAD